MASSSSSSSCSPSSSAVTIPIPGKSILKRPPVSQQSLFSRITRFLPTPGHQGLGDENRPLRRAHFILPQIATVYPISSVNPPSTPTLKEEKKAIEDREAERRRRVVRGGSSIGSGASDADDWWSLDKVESFYRECCAGSEEEPDPAITAAFKNAAGTNPRSVDMSGVQLTVTSASILSDVFTIEWGLRKLVFRECNLDEHTLKPILHSLLIPGTLSFLSVASNRRLKAPAFRLIGAFVAKDKDLQFLDLSQNALDKRSIEYVTAALATAPTPGLVSLRLDDCYLRPAGLEALARAVRTSSLRNISLRHNRISATGAVALALMIRDYPDIVPGSPSSTPSTPTQSFQSLSSPPSTPVPSSPSLSLNVPLPSTPPVRPGPLPPPPRHPLPAAQTTYTPYIPRSRRGVSGNPAPNPLSPTGQPIPIITSSLQGGVTTRHPTTEAGGSHQGHIPGAGPRHDHGPSAALLDKVRALDALPRLGALRTLDLRGNDLRGGITYIAQVLKRNRTLKVLNLSENKLDVQCLVTIAEALKYNSSLETLDLSKNPCSGPTLEGIQSLRTAFTLNTALKRLFLSSTSLTAAGAIALAEFLPESTSLLHLDLTLNNLDIAGVMALSSGLKANHTMRCLDLNIPPGDEEFARMCRDILSSCVRNTEEAEKSSQSSNGPNHGASGRGLGRGVWGMIEDSELAKTIRKDEVKRLETDIIVQARTCIAQLRGLSAPSSNGLPTSPYATSALPREADISSLAKDVLLDLTNAIQSTSDANRLEELLLANDDLMAALKEVATVANSDRPSLKLQGLGLSFVDGSSSTDKKLDYADGRVPNGSLQSIPNGEGLHENRYPEPMTPKIDKGKGRAEPEPEEHEKVLSPTFMITEDEEDNEDVPGYPEEEGEEADLSSPTLRSRSWVEEEGEVFRKGTVLLGPEEMEGEFDGEELRRELLEAMVERPPPRPLDEFDIAGAAGLAIPLEPSLSPPPGSPQEPAKPPPRPYISRSRSSSTSPSLTRSPTIPTDGVAVQNHNSPTTSPVSPLTGDRPLMSRSNSSSK